MKADPYSLLNDVTLDKGLKKINVTCAVIFYVTRSKEIQFKFFDICSTTVENALIAETLFNWIKTTMKKDEIVG